MISPAQNFGSPPVPDAPAIAVDLSVAGEVRIGAVDAGGSIRSERVRTYDAALFPTFTDVLRAFERDSGMRLRGCDCIVAAPGACSSGTIAIARSNWTITRSGLTALFGRPVIVINEVAAAALAVRRAHAVNASVVGIGPTLDFSTPGRRGFVTTNDGIGLAVIEVAPDGTARAGEAEPGHLAFAPESELEDRLLSTLRRTGQVTWERVLMLRPNDPEWEAAMPGVTVADIARHRAALLGSFAANIVTAYVLWQGLLMVGTLALELQNRELEAEFIRRMKGGDRRFRSLLSATSCWIADSRRDLVMVGAAALLGGRA